MTHGEKPAVDAIFDKYCHMDMVINAQELQELLNETFTKGACPV